MDNYNEISVNTLAKMANTLKPLEGESFFLLVFDNDNDDSYVVRSIKAHEDTITCYAKAISILSESLERYKKEHANI